MALTAVIRRLDAEPQAARTVAAPAAATTAKSCVLAGIDGKEQFAVVYDAL
jgi:hypothetical protein